MPDDSGGTDHAVLETYTEEEVGDRRVPTARDSGAAYVEVVYML